MISPFCPKCKYKIASGTTCPVCGTSLNASTNESKLDSHVYDVHYGQRTIPKVIHKKEKKDKTTILLSITVLIILILIITIILLIF